MIERKKTRLFLDASVIFSAAFSTTGSAAFLISECEQGSFQAVASKLVLLEVTRNLRQKAHRKALQRFIRMVHESNVEILPTPASHEIERYLEYINAKDAHVLASASLANCDFVITWDKKHFKTASLASFPIRILTPEEFVKQFCV
jgi:predicted nucleic acid-binding protein